MCGEYNKEYSGYIVSDTNIDLFESKERIPRIQIMNNLNTNNDYFGCKYRIPWIQIMNLSIVACCVCVAQQIQGKHTISLCSNLWEPGLSRAFYQTIFEDFSFQGLFYLLPQEYVLQNVKLLCLF